MRSIISTSLALCLAFNAFSRAEEPATPVAGTPRVDTLNQASLQEAFRLLRDQYIKRDDLTPLEINRAALEGLLSRLDFGAELVPAKSDDAPKHTFTLVGEMLSESVAYLRPVDFAREELTAIDSALAQFQSDGARTLIIDFRCPHEADDYDGAAAFLNRLCPPNQLLFDIRSPGGASPRQFVSKPVETNWQGRLVLLIDRDTTGATETAAAVLQHFHDCLVIGEPSPGKSVIWRSVVVAPDTALRFAVAEVILPDEGSLFRAGIAPHIRALGDLDTKQRVFTASQNDGAKRYIYERERPRRNEAALVAGTNPELQYEILKTAGKPTQWDNPPLVDRVLQRAFDLLVARDFLKLDVPPARNE